MSKEDNRILFQTLNTIVFFSSLLLFKYKYSFKPSQAQQKHFVESFLVLFSGENVYIFHEFHSWHQISSVE